MREIGTVNPFEVVGLCTLKVTLKSHLHCGLMSVRIVPDLTMYPRSIPVFSPPAILLPAASVPGSCRPFCFLHQDDHLIQTVSLQTFWRKFAVFYNVVDKACETSDSRDHATRQYERETDQATCPALGFASKTQSCHSVLQHTKSSEAKCQSVAPVQLLTCIRPCMHGRRDDTPEVFQYH